MNEKTKLESSSPAQVVLKGAVDKGMINFANLIQISVNQMEAEKVEERLHGTFKKALDRKEQPEQVAIFHLALFQAGEEPKNEICQFIQYALQENPSLVNEPDCAGIYPLEWAVRWGDTELAKLLLDNKADPTKYSKPQNYETKNLIDIAEESGNDKMLKLLTTSPARKLHFFYHKTVEGSKTTPLTELTFNKS